MSDPSGNPDDVTGPPGGGSADDGEGTVGPPRWVKVFGLVALALVVLVVVLLLAGGGPGGHGPGRHRMSAGLAGPPPPVAGEVAPPG